MEANSSPPIHEVDSEIKSTIHMGISSTREVKVIHQTG